VEVYELDALGGVLQIVAEAVDLVAVAGSEPGQHVSTSTELFSIVVLPARNRATGAAPVT
jgi:hypothetical protein